MKLRRLDTGEPPDINFIPLIDVLLVIVIFLVCTTSFVRQSQLKVELPGTRSAETAKTDDSVLRIRVGVDGNFTVDQSAVLDANGLRRELKSALTKLGTGPATARAVIEADSKASHQSVVVAMDALASQGVARVSIATAGGRR